MPKGVKPKNFEYFAKFNRNRLGTKQSEEYKKKMSLIMKANGNRPPSCKGRVLSEESKRKIGEKNRLRHLGRDFSKNLGKYAKRGEFSAEKHWNWQGGKTALHERLRKTVEYEEWRKKVFERDNYTCQKCGQIGGYLEADHIKPFALYPELRLEISNGRTLCKKCHTKTETYGINFNRYKLFQ